MGSVEGFVENFGPTVAAAIAWVVSLVYPIHIWMTGVPHGTVITACHVSLAYGVPLGPSYGYIVATDFDGSWSEAVCMPIRCTDFGKGRDPEGTHPDAPSCLGHLKDVYG